ncbi:MAG: SHOCT domain-containing protein [Ruminococcus flavefaciens]|nr:SHOCT domain-containing protein [Ruminococcus flavefaciens]
MALFTDVSNVFSFESVIKFETDVNQYEVTVGKKGHPIARAIAGGAIFGPAGAVVGTMTAKDTRHRETRTGNRYVDLYYKDASQKSGYNKRRLQSADEMVIVKLEECLKRVFEVNEKDSEESAAAQKESGGDGYGKLIELKNLLDMDIITQEEFEQKKKEILGL